MNRLLLSLCLILISAGNALAQHREYTGGMKHTYIRKAPAPVPSEPAIPETGTGEKPEVETAKDKVWKKYMALAAGTSDDDNNNKGPQAPEKPESPTMQQKEQAPAPTGFAAILQDYQNNKTNRSQMKSLQIKKPSVDQPDKPMVEKPESQATTESQ